MAKHTSLSSLFTDIADAIRAKKGIAGTIIADNFPDEIAGITSSEVLTLTYDDGTTEDLSVAEITDMSPGRLTKVTRKSDNVVLWTKVPLYTPLDYIIVSGGAYHLLDYYANNNTRVVVDFQIDHYPTTNVTEAQKYYGLFGCQDISFGLVGYNENFALGMEEDLLMDTSTKGKRYVLDIDAPNNKTTLTLYDGGSVVKTMTETSSISSSKKFVIGKSYYNGTLYQMSNAIARIYSYKIYESGVLKFHGVPGFYDGEYGFYDKIQNEFYASAGTGDYLGRISNDLFITFYIDNAAYLATPLMNYANWAMVYNNGKLHGNTFDLDMTGSGGLSATKSDGSTWTYSVGPFEQIYSESEIYGTKQ